MTPLFRLVTPSAMRGPASSSATLWPRAASAEAAAQPTTPAPTIATSTSVGATAEIDRPRLLARIGREVEHLVREEIDDEFDDVLHRDHPGWMAGVVGERH